MSVGKCDKCHQSVLWVKDTQGKNVPLDLKPIRVASGAQAVEGGTVMVRPARAVHFDTCKPVAKETGQRKVGAG